jgi:hypothetical protein
MSANDVQSIHRVIGALSVFMILLPGLAHAHGKVALKDLVGLRLFMKMASLWRFV